MWRNMDRLPRMIAPRPKATDEQILELMRLLAPVVEDRRHHGLEIEDAEVYARTVLAAGWQSPEQVEQSKAVVWDEGEADGRHNEHEFRPGKQMTNPYRKAKP